MATPPCSHSFPGFCRLFSPERGVHTVVNMGGVVKTLRRSNSLSRPLGKDSIARKIRSLRMNRLLPLLENPNMLLEEAQNKVNCMIRQHHRRRMRDWKAKARLWKISEPAVYSYLKNQFPAKLSAIVDGEDVLTHPWDIQATLMCFWQGIESWTDHQRNHALEALEDKYSLLLPKVEVEAS